MIMPNRAIAAEPEVLMDGPCSALDPIATAKPLRHITITSRPVR
jgi:ABC-type phosphate transport system ATPase subunit